jgi:serine/threonine protein kinase
MDVGQRLGSYAIVAPLGAGGMGEVWRATDTKLHRDVAIKVLPSVVARDPGRLARFEREAQLLAALNHPSIAAIHGREEASGTPWRSRKPTSAASSTDLKPGNVKVTPDGR